VFAIAFDLDINVLDEEHPENALHAYGDITRTLRSFGLYRAFGNLYLADDDENMSNLFNALRALKEYPWFASAVRDIHAFRVEQWSNFIDFFETA